MKSAIAFAFLTTTLLGCSRAADVTLFGDSTAIQFGQYSSRQAVISYNKQEGTFRVSSSVSLGQRWFYRPARYTTEAPTASTESPTSSPTESPTIDVASCLRGGDGFLEFGEWRVGNVDDVHFSFSHSSGKVSVIYRKDGNVHPGPHVEYGLWNRPRGLVQNVQLGKGFIAFSNAWRLGLVGLI